MAQHSDKTIDNASGQQVRLDLQGAIQAVATNNFGARNTLDGNGNSFTVLPCEFLADSTTNKLLIRKSSGGDQAHPSPSSGTAATFFTVGDLDQNNLGLLPRSGGTSVPMTGQFVLDNSSSSSAPSLTFNGDSDTGIYRKRSNTIGFATAGVERATISSASLSLRDISIFFPDQFGVVGTFLQGASTITAPSGSASVSLTLPGSIVDGGFLKTDASGNLSFSTISSAASDLTGSTLASGVTASSLTSVGTLTALTVSGDSKLTTIKDTSGNNPSTPVEVAQGRAKAWVNFNGQFDASGNNNTFTAGNGIRDSFNVSSVTDHGTGDYTVNLESNAVANSNYAVAFSTKSGTNNQVSTSSRPMIRMITGGYDTSGFRVIHSNVASQSASDPLIFNCIVFGD